MKIKADIIYVFSYFCQCHSFTLAVSLSQSALLLQHASMLRCTLPLSSSWCTLEQLALRAFIPTCTPSSIPLVSPLMAIISSNTNRTSCCVFTPSLLSSRVKENTACTLRVLDLNVFRACSLIFIPPRSSFSTPHCIDLTCIDRNL